MPSNGDTPSCADDATFGSNNAKFPLFTLLVVDDFGKGVPFAWMVASRAQT
jgi:hypothetical protein